MQVNANETSYQDVKDIMTNSIEELKNLTNKLSISGMPVVDNGQLRGIVTGRDFRYAENMDSNVSTIMTPFEKLVTVNEGFSQEDVMQLMYNLS